MNDEPVCLIYFCTNSAGEITGIKIHLRSDGNSLLLLLKGEKHLYLEADQYIFIKTQLRLFEWELGRLTGNHQKVKRNCIDLRKTYIHNRIYQNNIPTWWIKWTQ